MKTQILTTLREFDLFQYLFLECLCFSLDLLRKELKNGLKQLSLFNLYSFNCHYNPSLIIIINRIIFPKIKISHNHFGRRFSQQHRCGVFLKRN